jgi:ACS family hexuronate transporter-like MFS transporter
MLQEMDNPQSGDRYRWYVAVLLCLATLCNYLDRQDLSVLAHTIQQDLKLSTTQYSYITSSFLLSYAIMYAVAGRLVDRLGVRKSFLIFVSGWSVADILHAFARSVLGLAAFRFLLGGMEAANLPTSVKAVSEWFPMEERALAVGIFNSGTALGAGVAVPLVSFVSLAFGWRMAFVATGSLSLLWVVLFAFTYRPPRTVASSATAVTHAAPSIKRLLHMREAWGCIVARALTDPVTYFLVFWIPKFLQEQRGFSLKDLGRLGWIPFAALAVGNLAGGAIPRYLTSRGWPLNRARKTIMLMASCLMPVCCLLLTKSGSAYVALALLGGMGYCHGTWANVTLPSEVFPARVVGTITGMGGTVGSFFGVLSQLSIGWVVQHLSFTPIFAVIATVYLIAFAFVCWLIPQLGVIREIPA